MIFYNAEISRSMTWSAPLADEAGDVARKFLEGEWQLLQLTRSHAAAAIALSAFLEATKDFSLTVHRNANGGEILVRPSLGPTLLVTGKTASVLSSYLDEAPVRMQDRFDMTVRRRVNV
jgi:hypothetical protein